MIKTFTPSQFKNHILRKGWKRKQSHSPLILQGDCYSAPVEPLVITALDFYFEKEQDLYLPYIYGGATIASTLEGVTVTCHKPFHGILYDPHSLSLASDGWLWTVDGAILVDQAGVDSTDEALERIAKDFPLSFSEVNLTPIREQTAIVHHLNESESRKSPDGIYFLESDYSPSICFTGELMARVTSSGEPERLDFSGKEGHWTELALYRSTTGVYVGSMASYKNSHDEHFGQEHQNLRRSARVLYSEDAVSAFFGHHWLAGQLIEQWKSKERELSIPDALKMIKRLISAKQKKSNRPPFPT